MLSLFQKKEQKDPICGMVADEKFISKYGKKFCSEKCLKAFEANKHNNKECASHSHDVNCGCCG